MKLKESLVYRSVVGGVFCVVNIAFIDQCEKKLEKQVLQWTKPRQVATSAAGKIIFVVVMVVIFSLSATAIFTSHVLNQRQAKQNLLS